MHTDVQGSKVANTVIYIYIYIALYFIILYNYICII